MSSTVICGRSRKRRRGELLAGRGQLLADLLECRDVSGWRRRASLPLLSAAVIGSRRFRFSLRSSLSLLLQPDDGRAGRDQDLVEPGQRVAHLLDGLLEHDLRVLGER